MIYKLYIFILGFALLLPVTLHAQPNLKRGEDLLLQRCYGCHGEDVYVRENRLIKNFSGLQKRVEFCVQQVNVSWFPDEISDVVAFLNSEYYHFNEK